MPRRLNLAILIGFASGAFAMGAIFPETWGAAKISGSPAALALDDRPLAEELGFEAGEKASYSGPMGKFDFEARRFKDPTAALVYYFAARPDGSGKAPEALKKTEPLAVTYAKGLFWAHGNYVLRLEGWTPTPA